MSCVKQEEETNGNEVFVSADCSQIRVKLGKVKRSDFRQRV